jgi:hypothetical protein
VAICVFFAENGLVPEVTEKLIDLTSFSFKRAETAFVAA